MKFILLNTWMVVISINKIKDVSKINIIANFLVEGKKLNAIKLLKGMYDISIKDSLKIFDEIINVHWVDDEPIVNLLIKKRNIKHYLINKLEKYKKINDIN